MVARANIVYNRVSAKLGIAYPQLKLAIRCLLDAMAEASSKRQAEVEDSFFTVKKNR